MLHKFGCILSSVFLRSVLTASSVYLSVAVPVSATVRITAVYNVAKQSQSLCPCAVTPLVAAEKRLVDISTT